MNFAIISAGEGSRLKNEGAKKPKALVEVNGKPLISYIVDIIMKYSDTLNIIVNEQSTEILDFLILEFKGIKLNPVIKTTPSSLHSLYELTKVIGKKDFTLFTVDSIFSPKDFDNFIKCSYSNKADATIAVTPFIDDEKPLYVRTNCENQIIAFEDDYAGQELVTGGIYHLCAQAASLAEDCVLKGMSKLRNFQRELLDKGLTVNSCLFDKIVDVDHIKDIKTAEAFLAEMTER